MLDVRRNHYMVNGLIYLKDLFCSEKNAFKTRQQLINQYNIHINYFEHMCLIPNRHKTIIRNCNEVNNRTYGELVHDICSRTKVLRYTYSKIIAKLPFEIKVKTKWENLFGKEIVASEWKDIFTFPKKTTLDSQTRIFQFKILHRILPTNSLLYKYQIRNDP